MNKIITVLLIMVCGFRAHSQTGDFIVIKKNNETVKTFFKGSFVTFKTLGGQWFNAHILNIKNDSLFFNEVIVQQVPTPWGVPRLDTMTTYPRKIIYTDIVAIPRRETSFGYVKNGSLFMILGAGYVALNLINSGYQKYAPFGKNNRNQLFIAAGVFGLGKLMHSTRKPYLNIGKKYTARYIKA